MTSSIFKNINGKLFDASGNYQVGVHSPGGEVFQPLVLAQSGAPTILSPSGNSNATGGLTLGTALPYTPAGVVQLYLPAGVVLGGSQGTGAKLYSVAFSSTTVCQLVGTDVVTANGAYAQTTATDIPLVSVRVPGGLVGLNGGLRVTAQYGANNTANTKTVKAFLNTVNASIYNAGLASWTCWTILGMIRNRNSQSAQISAINLASGLGSTGAALYGTVDTSLDQPVVLTAQIATATDFVIVEAYTVEVLPG